MDNLLAKEVYTIGLDFGSLSARVVLMRISDATVVYSNVRAYPHGVLTETLPETVLPDACTLSAGSGQRCSSILPPDYALQVPADYRAVLYQLLVDVVREAGVQPSQIIGVGLDATSSTLIPTASDGTPMCELAEFRDSPHAYIKMWKHHGARKQAGRIQRLAEERHAPWLQQFGGFISAEHFLPKAAQIAEEAPVLYDRCGRILEIGDWLVRLLTGTESRNYCAAAFKTYCSPCGKDLPSEFLAEIDPRLRSLPEKLSPHIVHPGDSAGVISEACAKETGLLPGTPVSAASIDAHVTAIGCRTARPGEVLLIIGTSTCVILSGTEYQEVSGISGVVPDGILAGENAYEGGQSAVGDLFAYFCDHYVPEAYAAQARAEGKDIQQLLTEKASLLKPGESGLIALDWVSGVRSMLMDFDLSGLLCGVTLKTRPEDIYRALLEATAYGAYTIVSGLEKAGVTIRKIYASGGIPLKNPLLAQIYADVFGRDITVVNEPYSAAVGSAMLGLAASGKMAGYFGLPPCANGYHSLPFIMDRYAEIPGTVYHPIAENTKVYKELYAVYLALSEQFGKQNSAMKQLKKIREKQV